MTSKERVLTALDHKEPDRCPCDYLGTPEVDEKLKTHFQTDSMETVLEKAAIYEGDEIIRGNGRYQILTNYYQSRRTVEQARCRRMRTAEKIFSKRFGKDEPLTVDLMKMVLEAVHQEGKYGTKYSSVYDLTHGDVYLYCNHDFDVVVKFNITQELAKGARRVSLPSWFVAGKPMDFTRTARDSTAKTPVESEPKDTPPGEAKDRETGDND